MSINFAPLGKGGSALLYRVYGVSGLYRFLCSLLVAVGLLMPIVVAEGSGITSYPALVSADYWLK